MESFGSCGSGYNDCWTCSGTATPVRELAERARGQRLGSFLGRRRGPNSASQGVMSMEIMNRG